MNQISTGDPLRVQKKLSSTCDQCYKDGTCKSSFGNEDVQHSAVEVVVADYLQRNDDDTLQLIAITESSSTDYEMESHVVGSLDEHHRPYNAAATAGALGAACEYHRPADPVASALLDAESCNASAAFATNNNRTSEVKDDSHSRKQAQNVTIAIATEVRVDANNDNSAHFIVEGSPLSSLSEYNNKPREHDCLSVISDVTLSPVLTGNNNTCSTGANSEHELEYRQEPPPFLPCYHHHQYHHPASQYMYYSHHHHHHHQVQYNNLYHHPQQYHGHQPHPYLSTPGCYNNRQAHVGMMHNYYYGQGTAAPIPGINYTPLRGRSQSDSAIQVQCPPDCMYDPEFIRNAPLMPLHPNSSHHQHAISTSSNSGSTNHTNDEDGVMPCLKAMRVEIDNEIFQHSENIINKNHRRLPMVRIMSTSNIRAD